MKFKKYLLLTAIASCLFACSGGGGTPGSTQSNFTPTPQTVVSPLTIDNTGVVPAFTDSSTSVQVYLHNNTNSVINDIQYSWEVNLSKDKDGIEQNFLKINANTNSSLSTIAANGALAFPIHIPAIKNTFGKGSALLKVKYTYNGKQYTFSHVVDFQLVQNNSEGANLSSGAVSSSFGNHLSGYTTLYVYGGGKTGTVYNINSIQTDPVLGHIVQGDLTGNKLASHQVASIELDTAQVNKDATGQIKITSADSSNNIFNSSKTVTVLGEESGTPMVLSSLIPFIDTATVTTGKLFFYNAGSGTATLSNIKGSLGITGIIPDASCSSGFGAGQSCSVSFTLAKNSEGSGAITATASGGENISAPITWYDSNSSLPQLGLSTDTDHTPFILHGDNPGTGSFDVTVTNLSNTTIANLQVQAPDVKSGNATAVLESAATCNGKSLSESSPSCSYSVSVTDSTAPDNGMISLSASGTADGQTVSAIDEIVYEVYKSASQLALDFNPNSITISGDNAQSKSSTFTISNIGTDASADIQSLTEKEEYTSISGNPKYNATTACSGKPLLHGKSCKETVTLIPQSYSGTGVLQASLNYLVGGDSLAPVDAKTPLLMTVQPSTGTIELSGVTAKGSQGGDGKESSTAVKFLAGKNNIKETILTYKNMNKTESVTIDGISFTNTLPAGWLPEYSDQDATSCYSDGHSIGKTLAPNATCTVTLDNDLYLLGDTNNTTNLTFGFPTFTVTSKGGSQYSFVPNNQLGYNDNKYYANNYQAIIIDTDKIENNGESPVLNITHTAVGVNSGGYAGSAITEKTQITPEIYLNMPEYLDNHCSTSYSGGAIIENCKLDDGYTVKNSYNIQYAESMVPGVDPNKGGQLTINYFDQLNGKAWAYNNDANAVIAGVNGGGDYLSILPKMQWVFGGYSQWLYKGPDSTLYTFQNNISNGSVFNKKGYAQAVVGAHFTGGINAIASTGNKVFVATGNGDLNACTFNQATGKVNAGGCGLTHVGNDLTGMSISNGHLYTLDNKGKVNICNMDETYATLSCHLTATDAPQLTIGSGRQQQLMFWDGSVIYTVPGKNNTQYIACTEEANGELDSCKQLNLNGSESSTTSISTSILMPTGDNYAYLYTMSRVDSYNNEGVGCVLQNNSGTITVGQCNSPFPKNLYWGGLYGMSKNASGDRYNIYYNTSTKHVIGTITTSNFSDGDTGRAAGGDNDTGQEFYLTPNADHTINNPSYIQTTSFTPNGYYLKDSIYDQYLNNVTGNVTGTNGGHIILDTLSIH